MNYRRDFTIGVREAGGLYRLLALEKWWKGILGFGLAGALTAWMYLGLLEPAPEGPVQVLAAVLAALAVMFLFTLGLLLWSGHTVRSQARLTGRTSYVQETEIDGFGIRVTVGKDRARLTFDRLVRVWETRRAFYLFLSADQAWILPKNQMEHPEEDCRALRELFQQVVERRKLHLKK